MESYFKLVEQCILILCAATITVVFNSSFYDFFLQHVNYYLAHYQDDACI